MHYFFFSTVRETKHKYRNFCHFSELPFLSCKLEKPSFICNLSSLVPFDKQNKNIVIFVLSQDCHLYHKLEKCTHCFTVTWPSKRKFLFYLFPPSVFPVPSFSLICICHFSINHSSLKHYILNINVQILLVFSSLIS